MRWGIWRQHAAPSARCEEDDGGERGSKGKGKAFSFSPLSWFAKLAAKDKPVAATKRAPAPKNTAAAAPAFPSSFLPKRTSPTPAAATVTPGSSSPPRRSTADAAVPRRLSVGNDTADSVAARRKSCRHGRRHCSVGGDRELPPLGRLIPFSLLAGSPARAAAAPSDTDAAGAGARRHRRRRSSRRLSVSGGRRPSFSGRMPPLRVRVRSPRRAAAAVAPAELEGLAVVRRTRDPQRAFRESMVEMIASAGAGGGGPAAATPRPEELERLLACYLSLNADEHHDCIVKVFRQVWFEYVSLLPRLEAGRRRRPPTARRR
ncbi:unnamed protein product [Miscanthus lutarioriparius]|uniref:Transcription repressor n=1 Tax=Miscanthus lutarioriparius TaxID=422564 RepID=A0A811RTM8_9POAL|nr:unnamed protein product [Miscanthus lutarioriparius]